MNMNKFMTARATRVFRVMANKLHLSSLASSAPKTCSLLMIIVFGLMQLPIPSTATAQPPQRARLVFDTSGAEEVPGRSQNGFRNPVGPPGLSGTCEREIGNAIVTYRWTMPNTIGPQGGQCTLSV